MNGAMSRFLRVTRLSPGAPSDRVLTADSGGVDHVSAAGARARRRPGHHRPPRVPPRPSLCAWRLPECSNRPRGALPGARAGRGPCAFPGPRARGPCTSGLAVFAFDGRQRADQPPSCRGPQHPRLVAPDSLTAQPLALPRRPTSPHPRLGVRRQRPDQAVKPHRATGTDRLRRSRLGNRLSCLLAGWKEQVGSHSGTGRLAPPALRTAQQTLPVAQPEQRRQRPGRHELVRPGRPGRLGHPEQAPQTSRRALRLASSTTLSSSDTTSSH